MSRYADSLYARLALLLLLALGASYATMYFLFLSHLEETRITNIARSLASKIQLLEELMHSRPIGEIPPLKGLSLSDEPQIAKDEVTAEARRFVAILREHLVEEMGREVTIVPVSKPSPGLWINLHSPEAPGEWLLVAMPPRHSNRSISLIFALLAAFAVIFAGGMMLLWQIQRPLKRLGKALEAVGHSPHVDKLPLSGSGEIRILGERYNEMVERLHRYEEDRATMLAGVSHDLRTPITRLRLLMELGGEARNGQMIQNIDDIQRITEQFLVYARGCDNEPLEERNAALFVDEVIAPYFDQGVSLVCDHDDIRISIRSNSLRRALINLIENALEYGRPPVIVRIIQSLGMVTIGVEDAGGGIPPGLLEQALRPFSRLDSTRSGKGHCGLGLVIVVKIVEEHLGKLKLRTLADGRFAAEICLPSASRDGSMA